MTMRKGIVKWFSDLKGYGFILDDGGGPDIFVHHRAIEGKGYRTLLDGEEVLFEWKVSDRGPIATRVVRQSPPAMQA
jgi:CspA family cold shock protein